MSNEFLKTDTFICEIFVSTSKITVKKEEHKIPTCTLECFSFAVWILECFSFVVWIETKKKKKKKQQKKNKQINNKQTNDTFANGYIHKN